MALDQVSNNYAYDLSKNIISKGEIVDNSVISQSIEMILGITNGERLFNPNFGSSLPLQIFEGFTNKSEAMVDKIIDEIQFYEDRILIDRENVKFKFFGETGVLEIFIPYLILQQRIRSYFSKKVILN